MWKISNFRVWSSIFEIRHTKNILIIWGIDLNLHSLGSLKIPSLHVSRLNRSSVYFFSSQQFILLTGQIDTLKPKRLNAAEKHFAKWDFAKCIQLNGRTNVEKINKYEMRPALKTGSRRDIIIFCESKSFFQFLFWILFKSYSIIHWVTNIQLESVWSTIFTHS